MLTPKRRPMQVSLYMQAHGISKTPTHAVCDVKEATNAVQCEDAQQQIASTPCNADASI
jgi:hypothetical protein